MEKKSTPPFEEGEVVVAVRGGPDDYIQKGKSYIVKAVPRMSCGCYLVYVGVLNEEESKYAECPIHRHSVIYTGKERGFLPEYFRRPAKYKSVTQEILEKFPLHEGPETDLPVKKIEIVNN